MTRAGRPALAERFRQCQLCWSEGTRSHSSSAIQIETEFILSWAAGEGHLSPATLPQRQPWPRCRVWRIQSNARPWKAAPPAADARPWKAAPAAADAPVEGCAAGRRRRPRRRRRPPTRTRRRRRRWRRVRSCTTGMHRRGPWRYERKKGREGLTD